MTYSAPTSPTEMNKASLHRTTVKRHESTLRGRIPKSASPKPSRAAPSVDSGGNQPAPAGSQGCRGSGNPPQWWRGRRTGRRYPLLGRTPCPRTLRLDPSPTRCGEQPTVGSKATIGFILLPSKRVALARSARSHVRRRQRRRWVSPPTANAVPTGLQRCVVS